MPKRESNTRHFKGGFIAAVASLTGDLNVASTSTTEDLAVTGALSVTGVLDVTDNVNFSANFICNGSMDVENLTVNSQANMQQMAVTGNASIGGVLSIADAAFIGTTINVYSHCAGTLIFSGTGVQDVISLSNVKSDSVILLTVETDVASDQIINWVVTSKVEAGYFGVHPTAAPTADVNVNYIIFGPRT
ncbi:MAG TPA: hypothetical protein ENH82_12995 [bacterium]|nr:hypothetical protein [bacterium]